MAAVLRTLSAAGVRGVCGINSVGSTVVYPDGTPALGPSRPTSGICGAAIHRAACEWVVAASDVVRRESLGMDVLACGGAMCEGDLVGLLDCGASVAMTATGMMWCVCVCVCVRVCVCVCVCVVRRCRVCVCGASVSCVCVCVCGASVSCVCVCVCVSVRLSCGLCDLVSCFRCGVLRFVCVICVVCCASYDILLFSDMVVL